MKSVVISILLATLWFSQTAYAQPTAGVMSNQKLDELIKRFDGEAIGQPGFWQFSYENIGIVVVTDERADRMRIMVKVTSAEQLNKELLFRLMQANFDSALDARYAIAKGVVWSTFIHPLSPLSEQEFFSGLAQVITLASTFGSSFSSGALIFNGGDSREEHQKLFEEILKRGNQV